MLSEAQLRAMMPLAGNRLDAHLPYIAPALEAAAITTPRRIAAFMAQLAHESGEFQYMEEIWGPTEQQLGYEGRADLGNILPGDGRRFKGHGPIQITGREGHARCGAALGIDLIAEPTLICRPEYATRSACWFWNDKAGGLSPLADRDWFLTITRFINGGYNGRAERAAYWRRNRALLGLPAVEIDREPVAIAAFQASRGLAADGIVGRDTLRALA